MAINTHKTLGFFSKHFESIKSLKRQWFSIIAVAIGIIVAVLYIYLNSSKFCYKSPTFFADIIDPVITSLTFVTALIIGWYNLYANWLNSIEKRLTVFYVYYYNDLEELKKKSNTSNDTGDTVMTYKKEEFITKSRRELDFIEKNGLQPKTSYCVMICEEALLAHEGDIRNWAQQLGRQFAKENLSFHPFFTLGRNNQVVKIKKNNHTYITRQYNLFYFLDSIPQCVLEENRGILWTDNYDDDPTSTKKYYNIIKINYKQLLDYRKSKDYIDKLKT